MIELIACLKPEAWIAIFALIVSVASLSVAIFSLNHQRRHDIAMAEPHVIWTFGVDEEGFVEIGLENVGPGIARFIRSEFFVNGVQQEVWNWQLVFDTLAQKAGSELEVKDIKTTLPKTIFSGNWIKLIKIKYADFDANEVIRRLSSFIEISYIYRSNLDKKELKTNWVSLSDIGAKKGD